MLHGGGVYTHDDTFCRIKCIFIARILIILFSHILGIDPETKEVGCQFMRFGDGYG